MPYGDLNVFIKLHFVFTYRLTIQANGRHKEKIGREKNKEKKIVL